MAKDRSQLFESDPIPSAVAALAVPMVMSSLVMILYNLADTYFVGLLNDSVQTAAVTLAAPVLLAFNAVNNLFGVGTSSLMSRALGSSDYDRVRRASSFGFYCSLFSAVLFSAIIFFGQGPLLKLLGTQDITYDATLAYLKWTAMLGAAPAILNVVMGQMVRAEGSSLHASIGTMSGCILNIILDPIFILPFGFNMGASGAGLATLISNCFACAYFIILNIKQSGKTYVCFSIDKFSFRRDIALPIFSVGVPASIQNLLNVTGMTILNNFTAAYGAEAVAAMGISQKIAMIPMQMSLGISQGVMPLIGYNYASGNIKRMKDGFMFTVKIAVGFMAAMALLFFMKSGFFISLFMNNEAIINYGTSFLRCFSISLPFLCMDFMAVGVFQALGMGRNALIFAIMRKVILEIPLLFILNMLFPLYGIPCAQPVAEFGLAIAAVIFLKRIFSKLETSRRYEGEEE